MIQGIKDEVGGHLVNGIFNLNPSRDAMVSTWQWQIDSLACSSNTVQNGSPREPSDTISPKPGFD